MSQTMNEPKRAKAFAGTETLRIYLNETPVGILSLLPGDTSVFAFDDDYVQDARRPTLSLSFKSATGQLMTRVKPRRTKLDPFFSNLLPEGHLRDYLANKSGINKEREFLLLAALRDDLPGAVRLEQASDAGATHDLSDVMHVDHDDGPFSFSLAGVQLKFSAVNESKGGLTIRASGSGGNWIVKLPSSAYDSLPEAEYSMMTLARLSGIEVPQIKLVDTASVKGLPIDLPPSFGQSLAIERFDRGPRGKRIHAEDFAQVFGLYQGDKYGKASYENIASVLWAEAGENDVKELVRRIVFSTLIGNADMHVKNFSVLYKDAIHARLSPAYDLVPTILFMPSDLTLGLSLGKTKKMYDIDLDVLRKFAAGARIPEHLVLQTSKETVTAVHDAWTKNKSDFPLSKKQIEAIEKHMDVIPLAHGQ